MHSIGQWQSDTHSSLACKARVTLTAEGQRQEREGKVAQGEFPLLGHPPHPPGCSRDTWDFWGAWNSGEPMVTDHKRVLLDPQRAGCFVSVSPFSVRALFPAAPPFRTLHLHPPSLLCARPLRALTPTLAPGTYHMVPTLACSCWVLSPSYTHTTTQCSKCLPLGCSFPPRPTLLLSHVCDYMYILFPRHPSRCRSFVPIFTSALYALPNRCRINNIYPPDKHRLTCSLQSSSPIVSPWSASSHRSHYPATHTAPTKRRTHALAFS